MRTAWLCWIIFLCGGTSLAFGGEWHWNTAETVPSLSLTLGDDEIDQSFHLARACGTITLTLRGDGLKQEWVELRWSSDGKEWMSQVRKIPGTPTPWKFDLPPGRHVLLRIVPLGHDTVAVVRLLRN